MLTAVGGYYNGSQIVMDEDVEMTDGQRVIVTILDYAPPPKKKVDLKKYMGRGKKMFSSCFEADDYVKGLRSNDRI